MPNAVVVCDRYPELTETFVAAEVAALRRLGLDVRVEAAERPHAPAAAGPADAYWEDDTPAARRAAMARLAARHPRACLRDLRDRRRLRADEPVPPLRWLAPAALRAAARQPVHLHAHFATGPALAAMRIAQVIGAPFSLTAHGYDIYQRPANLAEKLRRATFATSGCAYTVGDLRRIGGPEASVHEIVMGVDGQEFRRRRPYPGGRTIAAVGRLVEKKGFADLVAATARMRAAGAAPDRVRIIGDGPLAGELAAQARDLGVDDLVELAGAMPHDAVRDALEETDVLCMPCVVAADGDRDSMPVVVKEALAMEVPVVATDEVGLPEVIHPEWGRLVPPRDPDALAQALQALLGLDPAQRRAMGAAGRAHVLEAADVERESAKLAALILSHG